MSRSPRVLVVDDEPVIALCVQAFLEDEGLDVTTLGSGEEAVACVGEGGARFDVCVLDARLPGLDGAATALRLHARCPALRFVFHTGEAGFEPPAALRVLGEVPVLHKPLPDMRVLAQAVHRLAGPPRPA